MGKISRYVFAALCGLYVSPLWAADLPVKAAPISPYGVNYDAFSGFYIGINGGYGWNRGATDGNTTNLPQNVFTSFQTAPQGFVGGFHVGYGNRFATIWYLGVEGDIDLATLDGTQQNTGLIGSSNSKNRVLSSIRARLGIIPVGHAMLYATGGYGWGTSDFTVTGTDGSQVNFSPTLSGAVLGGGIEVPFSPNWIARVEYLHYFLNDLNGTFHGTSAAGPTNVIFHADENVSLFRGGLSYKF